MHARYQLDAEALKHHCTVDPTLQALQASFSHLCGSCDLCSNISIQLWEQLALLLDAMHILQRLVAL